MNDTPLPPSAGGSYLRLPDGSLERIPDDPDDPVEPAEAAPSAESTGAAENAAPAEQTAPAPKKKGGK